MGPCLCGDTQCPSCGPAQGNWRCPICGDWADNLCIHMDEDGKDLKPEFHEEAKRLQKEEYELFWEQYAAEQEKYREMEEKDML